MAAAKNLDPKVLQNENVQLRQKLVQCNEKIFHLEEQLNWLKRQLFGKKSERDTAIKLDPKQLELEGFERLEKSDEKKSPVAGHNRKKPSQGKNSIVIPEDLPVETQILDIPDDQKICKETGVALVKIGEEVTHKLSYKPGSFYIKKIIRPKYAHPKLEEKGIMTADLPDFILPKCQDDNSFLVFILTKKFADHMRCTASAKDLQDTAS